MSRADAENRSNTNGLRPCFLQNNWKKWEHYRSVRTSELILSFTVAALAKFSWSSPQWIHAWDEYIKHQLSFYAWPKPTYLVENISFGNSRAFTELITFQLCDFVNQSAWKSIGHILTARKCLAAGQASGSLHCQLQCQFSGSAASKQGHIDLQFPPHWGLYKTIKCTKPNPLYSSFKNEAWNNIHGTSDKKTRGWLLNK